MNISIIIPAKNEAQTLRELLPELQALFPEADILVVDDGSTDDTLDACTALNVRTVSHPYNMGNGAAVKTGARHARNEILVMLDGDGQHRPEDIPRLLHRLSEGYHMVVGARNTRGQANWWRAVGNRFYNWLSSMLVGHRVQDLTSGMRVVRADQFREFLTLLPNGFSYPTTITMAFYRAGYAVSYLPISTRPRAGRSHLRLTRDGIRFLLIIFRVGTLYSPLKIFLPISLLFFLSGLGYYTYTFFVEGRFTNMSALLLSVSVLVFLIGLISEQITNLMYRTIASREVFDK